MNELIKIKQLPVLEEQFKKLGEEIDIELENVNNLIVNDETYKDIKKIRANFNKQAKSYDTQFKAVEKTILEPWEQVKKTYKENVALKYSAADKTLKNKISSIENELKESKEKEIVIYFEKYIAEKNLDFIQLSNIELNINISTSLKKLKEQVKTFVDKTISDLQLIENLEHKAEIMVEYKRTLDINNSIVKVKKRIEEVEEQQKIYEEQQAEAQRIKREQQEEKERVAAEYKKIEEEKKAAQLAKIEAMTVKRKIPTVVQEEKIQVLEEEEIQTATEKTKKITLKIEATESNITKLIEFLEENNYNYEKEIERASWWE